MNKSAGRGFVSCIIFSVDGTLEMFIPRFPKAFLNSYEDVYTFDCSSTVSVWKTKQKCQFVFECLTFYAFDTTSRFVLSHVKTSTSIPGILLAIPDALPDPLSELLWILPPQLSGLDIRRTLVIGTAEHRDDGYEDRLWCLHGRPTLGC